jgi:long-chain acyl-CoA synthetase
MSDTICRKFLETAKKQSERTAVLVKRGDRWNEIDWNGYRSTVEAIAAGLQTMGVRRGDRVAILSDTRMEWAATDLAILGLGAITVPIYKNSTPEDIAYMLSDSTAKILICESAPQARKLREITKNLKTIEKIICFEREVGKSKGTADAEPNQELFTLLDEVQAKGEAALKKSPTLYDLAVREQGLEDMATIIYTSGTTGKPKGVVLTHAQIMSEVADAFPLLGVTFRDRSLSFLPYAHVLGRIEVWGHALIGYTMAFAESIDRLKDNLIETSPTIMVSVPRVFEKIYIGILAAAEISPVRSKIFHWALSVGSEISRHKVEKQAVPIDLALKYRLAQKLVFNTILERLGGKLRFAVCGGAPLSQPIAEFFHAAGVLILEGYGLTETTGSIAVNTPFDYRFGTVGKAVGDVRFKIAEDGEILAQSKKIMKEYFNDPVSTSKVFTDGWFHTGDIGELSNEGYLRITDRKKDLIKTAGGKYVAPQKLEGLLKANRFISQVHIFGDQRKYVVALLTLNMHDVEKAAKDLGVTTKDRAKLIENPKVKELIRDAVAEANSHLASFESIKNFAILPNDFTVESGELTPSLKVRRKVVDEKYKQVIEGLYGPDISRNS